MPDAPLPTTTPSFVPEVFLSLPDSLAVSSSLDEISITPVTTTDDWAALSAAWDDLPVDRYMNDGGTYRRRRFSRFHHSRENGAGRGRLRLKAHAPYAQPLHLNQLRDPRQAVVRPSPRSWQQGLQSSHSLLRCPRNPRLGRGPSA